MPRFLVLAQYMAPLHPHNIDVALSMSDYAPRAISLSGAFHVHSYMGVFSQKHPSLSDRFTTVESLKNALGS